MEDIIESKFRWQRRDSKKNSKKTLTSDNRKSVRWLYYKAGKKSKDIQKDKEQKEKEKWLLG